MNPPSYSTPAFVKAFISRLLWAWFSARFDIFPHVTRGSDLFPSAQLRPSAIFLSARTTFASALMSHSYPTSSSSNNFQLIINNALKAYEKRTKRDLLAHPLVTQLQDCNSPADILAVLHQQVQGINQSRSSEDRWTKWLDPTVNILYTLSETLGEGVSLVSDRT